MDLKPAPPSANLTQLLIAWRAGEPHALARLTPLIYEELRRLAHGYMRGERAGHTLQATAIVHEAFMRLVQSNVAVQDRTHLFALVARLMRHVLVDYSKARGSESKMYAPWRGWRHFEYTVNRGNFADALRYLKEQYPDSLKSTNPDDYMLLQVHLNAEIQYRSAPAELGWSMRGLTLSVY